MKHRIHLTQDNIALHQLHFIGSVGEIYYDKIRLVKSIRKASKKFGCTSALLSLIEMTRHKCITKEKYEKMYKANEENEEREDLSVGEDLETFIRKVKDGKMNRETIPVNGDINHTFLLCRLDKEERKKLDQKDKTFMRTFLGNPDVPVAEWNESESNLKFARSICQRNTYFLDL